MDSNVHILQRISNAIIALVSTTGKPQKCQQWLVHPLNWHENSCVRKLIFYSRQHVCVAELKTFPPLFCTDSDGWHNWALLGGLKDGTVMTQILSFRDIVWRCHLGICGRTIRTFGRGTTINWQLRWRRWWWWFRLGCEKLTIHWRAPFCREVIESCYLGAMKRWEEKEVVRVFMWARCDQKGDGEG